MTIESEKKSKIHRKMSGYRILRIIGVAIAGVLLAALFALIFGFLVKILWNWLMPVLFGLPRIGYWQAFGIVILAKLIFGGFGSRHDDHHDHFHQRINSRWHSWLGVSEDKLGKSCCSSSDWQYYQKFWQEEGKDAFEAYLNRIKSQQNSTE